MRFWLMILHENALNLFGFGAFFFLKAKVVQKRSISLASSEKYA